MGKGNSPTVDVEFYRVSCLGERANFDGDLFDDDDAGCDVSRAN